MHWPQWEENPVAALQNGGTDQLSTCGVLGQHAESATGAQDGH